MLPAAFYPIVQISQMRVQILHFGRSANKKIEEPGTYSKSIKYPGRAWIFVFFMTKLIWIFYFCTTFLIWIFVKHVFDPINRYRIG